MSTGETTGHGGFQRDVDGAWWMCAGRFADAGVELRVGGADAPDGEAIARAERALDHLDALRTDAVRTLCAFLDRARFAADGFAIEGMDVGVGTATGADELALVLSHESDTYGAWSVTFVVHDDAQAALLKAWASVRAFTRRAV